MFGNHYEQCQVDEKNRQMPKIIKINFRQQLESFKYGLLPFLGYCSFLTLMILNTRNNDYSLVAILSILIFIIFFSPAVYLHIIYYLENRKTTLNIDEYSNKFTISINNEIETYDFKEIVYLVLHRSQRNYKKSPWYNYGYWELKVENGKIYYFTSLMIDTKKSSFNGIFSNIYTYLIPDLNKNRVTFLNPNLPKSETYIAKVEHFKNNFKDANKEYLEERIQNPKKFQPEAVEAAKELLAKLD